jgi:hypothetical protein
MTRNQSTEPASDLPAALAAPARRALASAGYTRLAQLRLLSEAELLRLHGMGPKAIAQLREALAAQGLAFASDGSAAPVICRQVVTAPAPARIRLPDRHSHWSVGSRRR